jgi:uncharacterized coiled-coil DUF342 family protein
MDTHKRSRTLGSSKLKHMKGSHLKSVGKMKKQLRADTNPMSAMQQVHLLVQERGFMNRQIEIFEEKIESVKEKRAEIDEKITAYKEILKKGMESQHGFIQENTADSQKQKQDKSSRPPRPTNNNSSNSSGSMTLDY